MSNKPVLIELEGAPEESPANAPEITDVPTNTAMTRAVTVAARRPSRLARWFRALVLGFAGMILSLAIWDFVTGLLARNPILGGVASAIAVAILLILLTFALRELATFARLRRIDGLRRDADAALANADQAQAQQTVRALLRLYRGRPDAAWGRENLQDGLSDAFDANATLALAESTLLAPLDAQATEEITRAARQVATVTAIVPLALADVAAALFSNLRMIRRIAEIYGGRGGTLANWRLTRSVMAHLVATGAVAVGDDLISSVAGGGLLSKVSRRFGEGVINGALTARVGVAAIEVCRPMPFVAAQPPRVTAILRRAMTGLFGKPEASIT